MTVRFDSSGDSLSRSSNLLNYNLANTIMGWFYIVTGGSQTTVFSLNDGSLNNFDLIGHESTGALRLLTRVGGGSPSITNGTTISTATWHHLALRRNANNDIDLLLNGVVDISNGVTVSARAAITEERVGVQVGGFAPLNGRGQGILEYSVALADAEIRAQMNATRPIRLANLVNFTPILSGTTGRIRAYNGVDWTANGTLTDEDPPPVGWGNSAIIVPFVAAAPTGGDLLLTNRSIANYQGMRQ